MLCGDIGGQDERVSERPSDGAWLNVGALGCCPQPALGVPIVVKLSNRGVFHRRLCPARRYPHRPSSPFGTGAGLCSRCPLENSRRRAGSRRSGRGRGVNVKAQLGVASARALPHLCCPAPVAPKPVQDVGEARGDVTGARGAPPPSRLKQLFQPTWRSDLKGQTRGAELGGASARNPHIVQGGVPCLLGLPTKLTETHLLR